MRTTLILCVLLACSLVPLRTVAAEWPGNWLGPADNAYRTLHIRVYYYGAVLHDQPDDKGVKPLPEGKDLLAEMAARPELQPGAMEAEMLRVKDELNMANNFYWRNSRFNCAFDYEWVVDYTPRLHSTIGMADAPYYSPVDAPAYGDARKHFDGLVQIAVLYAYDKETAGLKRIKGGGGFTWGCDNAQRLCGWSWWAATTADNVCGNDWLMVHEFGHQLDSLFEQSGHPEFWFNHIALREGNIARYGEHFDANAYILRRTPEQDWLDLKWGEVRRFRDPDQDNVPSPDEWITNRGLEADPGPAVRDTDGDGLDDFREFMASNGNRHGHGDRLHSALRPCDPAAPDTDGDGLIDGLDPLPMYPGSNFIPAAGPDKAPSGVSFVNTADGQDFALELSYQPDLWHDETNSETPGLMEIALYWGRAGAQDDAREVKLMLDLENNGWFTGDDNYRITVDGNGVTSVRQTKCADATQWPNDDTKSVDPAAIGFTKLPPRGTFTTGVKLTLTHEVFKELVTKPGTDLALNIGIRKTDEPWFYMLADPNSLMPVEMR